MARCGDCVWAVANPPGPGVADLAAVQQNLLACHRYPPTTLLIGTPTGAQFAYVYPLVTGDDGCGEFRPHQVEPVIQIEHIDDRRS